MEMDDSLAKSAFVKSADRALDLLDLVSSYPYQLAFGQVAAELGIPKSSLSPLLSNLVARGYLELDATHGTYGLGPRLRAIAATAGATLPVRQIIHRALEHLRDRINETVALYEVRGDEIEIVDRVPTRHALNYSMAVGDRAPIYAHSAGKVVLAYMTDAELEKYLANLKIRALGPQTPRSKSVIRRSAIKGRGSRLAFAQEELVAGMCGYAAPIESEGSLLAVVNVAVPVVRLSKKLASEIEWHLLATVDQVTASIVQRLSATDQTVPDQPSRSRRARKHGTAAKASTSLSA